MSEGAQCRRAMGAVAQGPPVEVGSGAASPGALAEDGGLPVGPNDHPR